MSPRHATDTATPASPRWAFRSAFRWLFGVVGVAGLAAGAACGSSVPHGPPLLQQVYWETRGGGQTLVWTSIPDPDASAVSMVSPAATQFDLVFDRVIDGSKVEDTVTTNGVSRQVPKAMPPVSVTWDEMGAKGTPPFSLAVWYNSIHLPIAGANTSYVYGREVPSYPSNTTISIHIDPAGITSKYDEPMAPLPPITVTTAPFAVEINPSSPDATGNPSPTAPAYVATNFWVPLQFNNIPVDVATQLSQYVEVRQNGVLLSSGQYQLVADPADPTLILLQPGSIEIWDSGAELDVALSAALPDIYGATLGTAQTASFIACQVIGSDAGVPICASPINAGTPDGGGGVADGGALDASDAGASDGGTAADASPDGDAADGDADDAAADAPVSGD